MKFRNKVRLLKVIDGKEVGVNSGSIWPNPIVPGESVTVGSITSRDWLTTTAVQSVKQIEGGVEIETLNSRYRIRPIP